MPIEEMNCELSLELHAFEDVLIDNASVLNTRRGIATFNALVQASVSDVVETVLDGDDPFGCAQVRCNGSQLQYVVEGKQRMLRLLILSFDYGASRPPIVVDGLSILYGERRVLERYTVHRGKTGVVIDRVPNGPFSDQPIGWGSPLPGSKSPKERRRRTSRKAH